MTNKYEYALQLYSNDELASFRNKFIIPAADGKKKIYFLGNSLGLQPITAGEEIKKVLDQWANLGVESFFKGSDPWLDYHGKLVNRLASVVGALPSELVVMNQLSVNLHLLLAGFYKPSGKRIKILCESKAFPSDQYVLETFVKHIGLDPLSVIIELGPRKGEHVIHTSDIIEKIRTTGDELALVFFGGLNYYTGQLFDMAAITEAAHGVNAKAGFDLAHAAGNVELKLHEWNVDFASWCNYKYMNAGPGAVASAFIHQRYDNDDTINRLGGWWGYKKESRFEMKKGFIPESGAAGWQLSTPSFILYACLKASLDIFAEASMERIISKSRKFQQYLFYLINDIQQGPDTKKFEILTPDDPYKRGSQVSLLMLNNGREIFDKLTEAGIFADWREPDVIRIAPVPLYNSFEEIWKFSDELKLALHS